MKKIFVATVQLTIEADNEHKAQDVVDNILSKCEMMADGALKDWNYLEVGHQPLIPSRYYGPFPT